MARQLAGHEAVAQCHLVDEAGRPGGGLGAQQQGELGVVRGGELVQLTGVGHHLQHVGELRVGLDGVGKGLKLLDELGVLDFVERARSVGHLEAGLELAVALAGLGQFPLAGLGVEALDLEGLVARARWLGGWCCSANSPLMGASSVKTAMASIRASMRTEGRRGGRATGATGTSATSGSSAAASTGSSCGSMRDSRPSSVARRGPARRALQRPCSSTPTSTTPPAIRSRDVSESEVN